MSFEKLIDKLLGAKQDSSPSSLEFKRRCRFETLEDRRVLSADPVVLGITYWETDPGDDGTPDIFEVTFDGGSADTRLDQFIISGDKDLSGNESQSDVVFDIGPGLPGEGPNHPFRFDAISSVGVSVTDVLGVSVSDDGLFLTIDLKDFAAGDKFVFTIDVDEVEGLTHDPIASAAEFERSQLSATFSDRGFTFEEEIVNVDVTLENGRETVHTSGRFYDQYNDLFTVQTNYISTALDLPADEDNFQTSRRAGGLRIFNAIAKPISFSGTVFNDADLDCVHGADEGGIEGVEIQLHLFNTLTNAYELAASTQTDANGDYRFDESLGLTEGTYRLVQLKADSHFNTGASAGLYEGSGAGNALDTNYLESSVIDDIVIGFNGGDAVGYDFKVVEPVSVGGHVYNDADADGSIDTGEAGIGNVAVRVVRTGAPAGVIEDPFVDFQPITVRTDATGSYVVQQLPPGMYDIFEINDYPGEPNPLDGFIDGLDSIGSVQGVVTGVAGNDQFTSVPLTSGTSGTDYNFGEYEPVTFAGTVFEDTDLDCVHDADEGGVEGVNIRLEKLDPTTNTYSQVSQTQTDSEGKYSFGTDLELSLGVYRLVQDPFGDLLSTGGHAGEVNGVTSAAIVADEPGESSSISAIDVSQNGLDATGFDFKVVRPVSLSGTVFLDANENGLQDASEAGIESVGVRITRQSSGADDPFASFAPVEVITNQWSGGIRLQLCRSAAGFD